MVAQLQSKKLQSATSVVVLGVAAATVQMPLVFALVMAAVVEMENDCLHTYCRCNYLFQDQICHIECEQFVYILGMYVLQLVVHVA